MDQSESSDSDPERHPPPSDGTMTMSYSLSTLASPRLRRWFLTLRCRPRRLPAPALEKVTVSGSRKPEGKSGKEELVRAVVGSSWCATRAAVLGHSQWVNRPSPMAMTTKKISWDPFDRTKNSGKIKQNLVFPWICQVKTNTGGEA
jgi:hypothetical protein